MIMYFLFLSLYQFQLQRFLSLPDTHTHTHTNKQTHIFKGDEILHYTKKFLANFIFAV